MSASYLFSALGGVRQFWVVRKDGLGQLRQIGKTAKGPEKGPFIHSGDGAALSTLAGPGKPLIVLDLPLVAG